MQIQAYDELMALSSKYMFVFNESDCKKKGIQRLVEEASALIEKGFDLHMVYELPSLPAFFWMLPTAAKIIAKIKADAECQLMKMNIVLGLPLKNLYVLSKPEVVNLKKQIQKKQKENNLCDFLKPITIKARSAIFSEQISWVRMS
jgi:hypothetical protein